MHLFPIGVEYSGAVAVKRLECADAREHEPGAAGLCSPEQVLDGDRHISRSCSALGSLVGRSVPERNELPAVGQDDRIFELAGPFGSANGANLLGELGGKSGWPSAALLKGAGDQAAAPLA
jgi:hypothetical protein